MTAVKKEKPKTRAELQALIDSLEATQHGYWKDVNEARQAAAAAREETKEVREQFADLKRRLHESEVQNARLNGYADRVHEDDIVRDGFVEVEDEQGKRQVPKRPSRAVLYQADEHVGRDFYDQSTGRTKRRTHWTSY